MENYIIIFVLLVFYLGSFLLKKVLGNKTVFLRIATSFMGVGFVLNDVLANPVKISTVLLLGIFLAVGIYSFFQNGVLED